MACLLQRTRAEAIVEKVQALGRVDAQEGGHILIVGQRGRQTDQANHLLRAFDLTHGARHDGLEHWTAIVVQQVNLPEKCRREFKRDE